MLRIGNSTRELDVREAQAHCAIDPPVELNPAAGHVRLIEQGQLPLARPARENSQWATLAIRVASYRRTLC